MGTKMNQPTDKFETLSQTTRGQSQVSASKGVPSRSPSTLPGPGENVTAHPNVTEMNGKTAPDQRTVPFMTTLQQAAGGPLPELMTLAELCVYLRVKRSYVYSLTSTDRIPHRKFGGTLRFLKVEILQWIDRGRRGPRMNEPARSDS